MGNHDVGRAFAGAADVFWALFPEGTAPSKASALKALENVGNRYRRADAEFDDQLFDQTTPLGKMIAIAFDAQPNELVGTDSDDDGEAWYDGPVTRFRQHFDFC